MSETLVLPTELKQVVDFMGVEAEQHEAVLAVYNAIEEPLRDAWDAQPQSARNVLANFEQFQAVVAYTLVGPTAEMMAMIQQNAEGNEQDEQKSTALMEQLFTQGIKMMIKDLKSARRDARLRNEFQAPFKG